MANIKIKDLKKEILAGKLFIYPTDTIYGLGCNAEDEASVNRIKEIKARDKEKPLSIIAPSISWIEKNFIVDCDLNRYLPGDYTLLLKKKNLNFLNWISSNDRIGIRVPANKFTKNIQKAEVPFVTTSANLSGEPCALKLEDIKKEILNKVDYIIEADEKLSGIPSTLIINGKEIERK